MRDVKAHDVRDVMGNKTNFRRYTDNLSFLLCGIVVGMDSGRTVWDMAGQELTALTRGRTTRYGK